MKTTIIIIALIAVVATVAVVAVITEIAISCRTVAGCNSSQERKKLDKYKKSIGKLENQEESRN